MADEQKIILVTGDLIYDRYLARTIGAPASYFGPPHAKAGVELGGAWYLAKLVKAACPDCLVYTPDVSLVNLNLRKLSPLAYGVVVWQPFDREKGCKDKEKRWRVAEFRGCMPPDYTEFTAECRELYRTFKRMNSKDSSRQDTALSPLKPDLLVIYDRGLGFGDNDALWPEALRNNTLSCDIVLKTSLPAIMAAVKKRGELKTTDQPEQVNASLWTLLIEKHKDRLTVVLSAASLRAGQVALSQGLSWEQTFDDLNRAFTSHPLLKELAQAKRVVVHFSGVGAAIYRQTDSQSCGAQLFVYDPDQLEGDWCARQEGMVFGTTSILTAAIARHRLDEDNYPLYNAVARALEAARINHAEGGGKIEGTELKEALDSIFKNNWNLEEIEIILSRPEITASVIKAIRKELSFDQAAREWCTWLKRIQGKLGPGDAMRKYDDATKQYLDAIQQPWGVQPRNVAMEKFENLLNAQKELEKSVERRQKEIEKIAKLMKAEEPFYPEYGFYRASFKFACSPENLLLDVIGTDYESVADKAKRVVLHGVEKMLERVPKARYGGYLAVDREEIERLNEIRRLVTAYRDSKTDNRPLSIAVFGPPGAGKSYAIKELFKELFPEKPTMLEFNLSQFDDRSDLHEAFHQVSSNSLGGKIPLVFWDEFDVDNLKWLKDFLAPMQDARFRSGHVDYDLGKAIFVFAGGTRSTFKAFDRSESSDVAKRESFGDAKGPDFVGRLRGYVNIKGPNMAVGEGESEEEAKLKDVAHLIRRAILLRTFLQKCHPYVIESATKKASIAENVVDAFLRAEKYRYGTRSLEAIVKNSILEDATYFGPDALPSEELLRLHVSDNFMEEVRRGERIRRAAEE